MVSFRVPRAHPEAVPFVPFFIGINLIGGVHLPFFPVWLESEGFTPESIGLLMMAMGLVRVVTGPVLGFLADAFAMRRMAIIVLTGVAAASYAGYAALPGVAFVVLFSITSSIAFSAVGPLIEGITLQTAITHQFDYGRVRSFGSAAFIVMNFASGVYLALYGIDLFLVILIAAGAFSFAMSLLLPVEAAAAASTHRHGAWGEVRALSRQPAFIVFLCAAGIAQACHAFYYGFGTLNWKSLGYSADLIGFLWGLGVAAEIVLFSFSNRIVAWLGPVRLLVIGTACGILRWTIVAFSPPLWLLIGVQCLHAGTFGAAHLGAMHFIARAVPGHLVGTAQSVYAAVTIGLFMSAGQFASGHLFADFGAWGYLLMTAASVLALGFSLLLGRLWHGGELREAD
ncbi:MAG: MFS transporter [Alphaproteobacteria bacterium]|nr:MFS transporter [Alphaproteobacteria bacterium]